MSKIDKKFLVFDPIIFVERALYREKRKLLIYKTIFITLNILLFLAAMAIGVLTPMVSAKMDIFFGKVIPQWFIFSGLIVSSATIFSTSIINFFLINERKTAAKENHWEIQAEIISFSELSRHQQNLHSQRLQLYLRVAQILGLATKGENHE